MEPNESLSAIDQIIDLTIGLETFDRRALWLCLAMCLAIAALGTRSALRTARRNRARADGVSLTLFEQGAPVAVFGSRRCAPRPEEDLFNRLLTAIGFAGLFGLLIARGLQGGLF